MAKTKVLFIADCIGADQAFHKKGTVAEFDDEKKSDVPTLASLKAAARIVPVTKENLDRCIAELEKKNITVKLTEAETKAGFTLASDELEALSKKEAKGKKGE